MLDDDPPYAEYNAKIINTLNFLHGKGKDHDTTNSVRKTLRELNRHVDLMNPQAVAIHINSMLNQKTKDPLNGQLVVLLGRLGLGHKEL